MRRRTRTILGVALVVALAAPVARGTVNARPEAPRLVATLEPGESVVWRGGASAAVHRFRLVVERGGARLRAFGEVPWAHPPLDGMLVAPDGRRYPFSSVTEAFVDYPQAGAWVVEVDMSRGASAFRVRAKLETRRDLEWPRRPMWLEPNLRSMPPFEFTFDEPYTGGSAPVSCHVEEMVEEGARRCLRFSVGPENVGAGPFEIYLTPLVGGTGGGMVVQRLLHSGGRKTKLREAGTYEYHKTHGHYHYAGFASLELFEVLDPRTGKLAIAGTGKKIGFCTVDVLVAQFERFAQDPMNSALSDCDATDGAWIGLSRGWADVYDWRTSGNYVEFGPNEDGLYVLRSGFDARDLVDETNERDNYAYALIEVEGTRVDVLERGYGKDPWDPHKEVVRPWWDAGS